MPFVITKTMKRATRFQAESAPESSYMKVPLSNPAALAFNRRMEPRAFAAFQAVLQDQFLMQMPISRTPVPSLLGQAGGASGPVELSHPGLKKTGLVASMFALGFGLPMLLLHLPIRIPPLSSAKAVDHYSRVGAAYLKMAKFYPAGHEQKQILLDRAEHELIKAACKPVGIFERNAWLARAKVYEQLAETAQLRPRDGVMALYKEQHQEALQNQLNAGTVFKIFMARLRQVFGRK